MLILVAHLGGEFALYLRFSQTFKIGNIVNCVFSYSRFLSLFVPYDIGDCESVGKKEIQVKVVYVAGLVLF